MSLLFVDGFDHYASADLAQKWFSTGTNATINSAAGRNSTPGLRFTSHNTSGLRSNAIAFGGATAIVGTAFNKSSGAASFWLIGISDTGDNPQGGVYYANGVLTIARSGGTFNSAHTDLATSSVSLSAGTYYYIELKYTINDTTGSGYLYVNGTLTASFTGADTRNTGTGLAGYVYLGQTASSAQGTGNSDYDDFYACSTAGTTNNDVLGPIRVVTALPDGAGNYAQFTPSTGSNYQNVDEASTDGDTTYNSSTTAGNVDTFTFGALGVTGSVYGVQTNLMVRSNGSGAETIRPKVRISATDYSGTTVGISTSYADSREVFEQSPATSSDWTVSEIDGAEFGIELVS